MARTTTKTLRRAITLLVGSMAFSSLVYAHGEVTPQPVNTDALPDVGEEWVEENPYREADKEVWLKAVEIGASGYNQNCARCHGLGAVSGGLAPDLRYLEADMDGDEWWVERFQNGYTQGGVTKMPAFGELLGQKASWAIRTYVETRPDEGALDPFNDRLKEIRDQLGKMNGSADPAKVEELRTELLGIAGLIETGSGAPIADSVASQAALLLDGTPHGFKSAADVLTVGLSAAK